MFWAQNFSCSNTTVPCSPSQGNSCTVNDWDTWFYSAYVVASELPGPQSCWLLCLECATRTCLLLIFLKFIRLSFALNKNYDSLDKFIGNLVYF